jgi:hypothetical protein
MHELASDECFVRMLGGGQWRMQHSVEATCVGGGSLAVHVL